MNKNSGTKKKNTDEKIEKVDLYTLLNITKDADKETIVKNNFIKCLEKSL
jgi:hypothetical protein